MTDTYLTLTEAGQLYLVERISDLARDGVLPGAFFGDAERAANNADDGEDIVIEIAAQHSADGRPHTINLARELFRAAPTR